MARHTPCIEYATLANAHSPTMKSPAMTSSIAICCSICFCSMRQSRIFDLPNFFHIASSNSLLPRIRVDEDFIPRQAPVRVKKLHTDSLTLSDSKHQSPAWCPCPLPPSRSPRTITSLILRYRTRVPIHQRAAGVQNGRWRKTHS